MVEGPSFGHDLLVRLAVELESSLLVPDRVLVFLFLLTTETGVERTFGQNNTLNNNNKNNKN